MAWIEKKRDRKTRKISGYIIKYWKAGRGSERGWSEVFDTKGKAQVKLPHWQAIEDAGKKLGIRQHAPIPLKELIIRYIDWRISKKKIDPAYRKERLGELTAIIDACGWTRTDEVTSDSVIAWHTQCGGRGSRKGAYLQSVLKWSRDTLHQHTDPVAIHLLKVTKSQRKVIERPASTELAAWEAKATDHGPNVTALIHCLRWYGWRPVTAAKMAIGDVILDRTTVILRGLKRGGGDIDHPLTKETADLLRKAIGNRPPTERLFIDPTTGKPWIQRGGIKDWWRKHIDSRPGKGIYNLKYEAISHMFASGLAPADIQAYTGHRDINQVMVYNRTNDASRRASLRLFTPEKPEILSGARVGHGSKPDATSPQDDKSQVLENKRSATS